MTELKKYERVTRIEEVNELVEQGYKLHTVIPNTEPAHNAFDHTVYIMSLQEKSKYDNVERFKKMPIETVENQVPEGWRIIHHTSKEMILVSP